MMEVKQNTNVEFPIPTLVEIWECPSKVSYGASNNTPTGRFYRERLHSVDQGNFKTYF